MTDSENGDANGDGEQGRDIVMSHDDTVHLGGTSSGKSQDEAAVLVYGDHAKTWWRDARKEVPAASAGNDEIQKAIRLQIVFAVCALETWFVEWVRDDILGSAKSAAVLFGGVEHQSVDERIKNVAAELHEAEHLQNDPDFTSPDWQDLPGLVDHRNGLVHGVASLPRGSLPLEAEEGFPTPGQLQRWAPVGPLKTVRRAVKLVTSFADSHPPEWMDIPRQDV